MPASRSPTVGNGSGARIRPVSSGNAIALERRWEVAATEDRSAKFPHCVNSATCQARTQPGLRNGGHGGRDGQAATFRTAGNR